MENAYFLQPFQRDKPIFRVKEANLARGVPNAGKTLQMQRSFAKSGDVRRYRLCDQAVWGSLPSGLA
jgi:hypothetical protein